MNELTIIGAIFVFTVIACLLIIWLDSEEDPHS